MTDTEPQPRRCHCDGQYEGCAHGPLNSSRSSCRVPAGGRWSMFFCPACDERRVKSISANLDAIAKRAGL